MMQVQQQHAGLTCQDQQKAQVARWRNRCMRVALFPQPTEVRPAGESACSWAASACLCRMMLREVPGALQARKPALQRRGPHCKRGVYTMQAQLKCWRSHGRLPSPQIFIRLLKRHRRWSSTAGRLASSLCIGRSWLWSRQLQLLSCQLRSLCMVAWQRMLMCAGKHKACCGHPVSCP